MRCQHCGKLIAVHTFGKGDVFIHRCRFCHGYHKFTNAGRHASGAINYRVTKHTPTPDNS